MAYYDEVYLHRINKAGKNRQDRIKTRKENEFDNLFMKRTEYLADIIKIDDNPCDIKCSLQPNKQNEKNFVGSILISTSQKSFKTGDLLTIRQQIKDEIQEKLWLVIFVDDNMTMGYRGFKAIWLDSSINLTDEYGTTQYYVPARFINQTSSLIMDNLLYARAQKGYREPNENRIVVMKDHDFLQDQKMRYFELGNRGWELMGFDNLSISGVAYATISERLKRDLEPSASKDILVGDDTNFFLNGGW